MSARYTGGLVYNAPGGWSGLFDGSGDYLSIADNSALQLTGDFTIEFWIYTTSLSSIQRVIVKGNSNSNDYSIDLNTNGTFRFNTSSTVGTSSGSISANSWNHVAVTRSGSTCTWWINGASSGTFTLATSLNNTNAFWVGQNQSTGLNLVGYLSNLRVVKGTVVYTSNFTQPSGALLPITNTSLLTCAYPTFRDGSSNNFTITATGNALVSTVNPFPTSQLPNPALGGAGNGVYTMSQYAALKAANLWPAFDPYYNYVTLNLHGNGTNAAQNNTFLDSSTNNFTITRNGNTTQGTFTPYGSNWSNYFDGSSAYLSTPTASAFQFGTGDFTVEMWAFANSSSTQHGLVASNTSGVGYWASLIFGNLIYWQSQNGTTNLFSVDYTSYYNKWTHIAYVRSSGTTKLYLNGVQAASAADTTNYTMSAGNVDIGRDLDNSALMYGYLSNVRIVKGTAVYTTTFTPSTTPLTAITNTVLLTCQSNRFVDNSASPLTLTANGSPSVQRFSPFSPTSAYSTSVIGGSGYFDGSGDYLTAPNTGNLSLPSGTSFTIEAWIYPTRPNNGAQSGFRNIVSKRVSNSLNSNYNIMLWYNSEKIGFYNGSTASLSSASIPQSVWTHFAYVYDGSSTIKLYLNGVLDSTFSTTPGAANSADVWVGSLVDDTGTSDNYGGYITDLRIVKGSQVYTTTFTPPTAPLTAISNTQYLLNYTNAAIFDNAMMNDLETVGNAQISTSVKKYGTGSIYLDGSADYVVQPTNLNFGYGTGDFTIEFWLYLNATGDQTIVSNLSSASSVNPHIYYSSAGSLRYYTNNADRITGSALSTGIWYHIALCRASSSTRLFINGTQTGSTYADSNNYGASAPLGIGTYWSSGSPVSASTLNGYIDDLRITKGVARYTTSFTPPTSQVQDQ